MGFNSKDGYGEVFIRDKTQQLILLEDLIEKRR
jgi:hypothetical protein